MDLKTIKDETQQNAYLAAFKVLSARYEEKTIEKIRLVYDGLDELNQLID